MRAEVAERHRRSLRLIQACLEGLLDNSAGWLGNQAAVYRSTVWESKDSVKRATAQLERVAEEKL